MKNQPKDGETQVDIRTGYAGEIRQVLIRGLRACKEHLSYQRNEFVVSHLRYMADTVEDIHLDATRELEMDASIGQLFLPDRVHELLERLGYESVGDVYYADTDQLDKDIRKGIVKVIPSIREAFEKKGIKWPIEM